jgi:hypothetical protein
VLTVDAKYLAALDKYSGKELVALAAALSKDQEPARPWHKEKILGFLTRLRDQTSVSIEGKNGQPESGEA